MLRKQRLVLLFQNKLLDYITFEEPITFLTLASLARLIAFAVEIDIVYNLRKSGMQANNIKSSKARYAYPQLIHRFKVVRQ
jgi:hypothetical protein